jgi:hypothetical protein
MLASSAISATSVALYVAIGSLVFAFVAFAVILGGSSTSTTFTAPPENANDEEQDDPIMGSSSGSGSGNSSGLPATCMEMVATNTTSPDSSQRQSAVAPTSTTALTCEFLHLDPASGWIGSINPDTTSDVIQPWKPPGIGKIYNSACQEATPTVAQRAKTHCSRGVLSNGATNWFNEYGVNLGPSNAGCLSCSTDAPNLE